MDYAEYGFSTGRTASSVADSADEVIKFLHAIGEREVDILGHSIGGFIAPMVALNAPDTLKVRKVVILASGPSAGAETLLNPNQDEVNKLVGGPDVTFANFSALFFPQTPQGTAAVTSWWARIHERNVSTSGEVRSNVLSYNYADGFAGLVNQTKLFAGFLSANQTLGCNGSYARLAQLKTPVLITNGNVRSVSYATSICIDTLASLIT
jgi:pimeloyl-ACP methyl ester carboxylesterase